VNHVQSPCFAVAYVSSIDAEVMLAKVLIDAVVMLALKLDCLA